MEGQLWATDTVGGYMSAQKLSKHFQVGLFPECRFRQFCDMKDAAHQGKGKGQTFTWNVYSKIATQGTTLVETTTMPKSKYTIVQGTLTIDEIGNSVDYTGKLDRFSEHPVKEIIDNVLIKDAKECIDGLAYAQFDANLLCVTSTASAGTLYFTTDGTATNTNNSAMAMQEIGDIYDWMRERDIPAFKGGDYFALSHPSTFRDVKDGLQSIFKYTKEGLRDIRIGEIGRFENIRFVEQTSIKKGSASDDSTNAITTAASWDNAKSSWAFFFGSDTVAEGVNVPEEVRGKIPGDYGRDKGLSWYGLLGFGIVHGSAAIDARILKWESAS